MEDALDENRTLVITSLILQKFCEVVACSMTQLPGAGYEPLRGVDQTRASHFQISVAGAESKYLKKWYKASGCGGPPPPSNAGDTGWGRKCFYSQLVRSFVTGPGLRLQAEKEWLRQYYVGSPARFDQVPSPSVFVHYYRANRSFLNSVLLRQVYIFLKYVNSDSSPFDFF